MRFLRRLLGALGLILATLGFVCCTAGLVGVWMVRQNVSRQINALAPRLDSGLMSASGAVQSIHRSLDTIRADVNIVITDPEDLEAGGTKNQLVTVFFRTILRRLANFSQAALAVASLFQSVQDSPLGQVARLDPEKWERLADRATQLSASLQKLQARVGEENKEVAEAELVAAAKELDGVLQKCKELVDECQSEVDAARAELPGLQGRILGWLTTTAVAATVLFAWGALSQISLLAHAWKWTCGG